VCFKILDDTEEKGEREGLLCVKGHNRLVEGTVRYTGLSAIRGVMEQEEELGYRNASDMANSHVLR